MNKPIKLNRNNYNNIYFASDFHYNHQRDFIWTPRGFKSYQEHDKFLENQCASLKDNDLLIYLGDYSLNSTDEQTSSLLHKTRAQIFYIFGNHEGYHSRFYRNSLQRFFGEKGNAQIFPFSVDKTNNLGMPGITHNNGKYCNDITYFGEEGYFQIGNNFYFCRHMAPLIWDRMKYDNQFALCGHSHGNLKSALPTSLNTGKILDVGVDVALQCNGTAFLTIKEIDEIMNKKKIVIHDHHGDDNI